jgi:hypothetical protein
LKSYILVAAGLAVALAPCSALAQSTTSQQSFATIAGVAVDSIRGGYLRNATISVSGTNRAAITDSIGRFTIDSVAPGEHALRIRHPLLDSIGLSVITPPRKIGPGETMAMLIATPGPATIVAAKCPADARSLGPAAVLGTVFDAETEDPSQGAQVSTTWSELQLGRKTISNVPQRRTATVSSDGTFKLCGLPTDLRSGIGAARGTDTTAAVPVDLSSGLAIVALHLPPPTPAALVPVAGSRPVADTARAAPQSAGGRAVLSGRITDVANKPVPGARAAIEEDRLAAVTGNDGTFRISNAKSGTRTLTVRKLGFEPVRMTVELTAVEPRTVDLKLAEFVPILETVRVSAVRDRALERNGFTARRNQGFGGHFITPEMIARRNSARVNDMLRGVSFLRFRRLPNGRDLVYGRPSIVAGGPGGCVRYYVDNIPWVSLEDTPDEFYHPSEIGAIEVYPPNATPPRFMAFSRTGELCYVVVLWTQSGLQLR